MTKLILTAMSLLFLVNCGPDAKTTKLMASAKNTFGTMSDKMPGSENDSKALIELGKKLFFEKRLSKNDSQSCNSCHNVEGKGGGVDNQKTSTGAFGEKGGRNSPTVLNAGFQFAQFWDGRAATLKDQAKGPILNPIEMAMPNEKAAVEKITGIPEYKALFDAAYPQEKEKITYDNIAGAIAAFERTLITKDRFSDFINGDHRALNDAEIKGLDLFISTGCTTCHNGPTIGGNSYRKIGEANPFPTADEGRFAVTKKPADKFFFKVPMLRNIALTGPYFHDGSVGTLEEAVKKMAFHQLNKELTDDEVGNIVKFLNALTDKARK